MKCEFCNNEHDGSFGSGRFCNISCKNKRSAAIFKSYGVSKEVRERLRKLSTREKASAEKICKYCGNIFYVIRCLNRDGIPHIKKRETNYCSLTCAKKFAANFNKEEVKVKIKIGIHKYLKNNPQYILNKQKKKRKNNKNGVFKNPEKV